jgi:hypothetical protein
MDAPKDQGSPGQTSRALAITLVAIYDAINSIQGTSEKSYLSFVESKGASVSAAVAAAAFDCLQDLYPSQEHALKFQYEAFVQAIPDCSKKEWGLQLGASCAEAIMKDRNDDGSSMVVEYKPTYEPGNHVVDPMNPSQGFATPQWGNVKPFCLKSGDQFLAPDANKEKCMDLESEEYAREFNHLKEIGAKDSKTRTQDELYAGLFWAYDGANEIGVPIRLLNQIGMQILEDFDFTSFQLARIFAKTNLAMADTDISSWNSKYHYNYWRPIVAIREGDTDGNKHTVADPEWEPFGAPRTNTDDSLNFTPNFGTYTSGHSQAAGTYFKMLEHFLGDSTPFTFVSDEMNGKTFQAGEPRPLWPRHYEVNLSMIIRFTFFRAQTAHCIVPYQKLSDAAEEMALSRVYIGIHWECDCTVGLEEGKKVADYAFGESERCSAL